MRRTFVALATIVVAAALMGPTTTAHADSADKANPLKWTEVTSTKCKVKAGQKAKITNVTLSAAVSKKRSAKSWGKTTYSAAGNLKTQRHYHNYPLKAERATFCKSGKVTKKFYPTKFKRYHVSQNFKKGGGSAYIPTFSIRTPNTGFSDCYRGYRHRDTLDKRTTCNGSTFS